jgi:RNA polymerase primary sigma factor
VPLLTRDGEIALARRIEAGDRQVLASVLDCPAAVDELIRRAEVATTSHLPASEVLVDVNPRHAQFDESARKEVLVDVLAALRRYRDQDAAAATALRRSKLSIATRRRMEASRTRVRNAMLARLSSQWFRARILVEVVETLRAADGAPARMTEGVRLGDQARSEMLRANLRLVVSVARKYRNRGVELLDLVQEGNIGLMKAIDKFDHRRGFRLATYATWWIRVAVSRAVAEQRTIRIPANVGGVMGLVARATQDLTAALGRLPSDEEIAERLNVSPDHVRHIRELPREPLSLETPIGTDTASTLVDVLEDPRAASPAQSLDATDLASTVQSALSVLTDREAKIVRLRFGIGHSEGQTLEEISHLFGVTRERIRQIEEKALSKLRRTRVAGRLRPLLEA